MKIVVAWSGGKDSQASLIWACEKYGSKNIEAVFCDTGWEHELTYKHVPLIANALGVKLTVVKSKKYNGFKDLTIQKGRAPSLKARFCTEELKVKPMIDWILDQTDHLIIVQGIRRNESENRNQMAESCTFFKYYFEPHTTNSIIVEKYKSKPDLSKSQREKLQKAIDRLALGKEDPKYFTYRKEEVFAWRKQYADDIFRPFIDASAMDVINYSLERNLPVNPLYKMGFSRVGCFPCIMASNKELELIALHAPERVQDIIELEEITGRTFFAPDAVPPSLRNKIDPKSGKKQATADIVFAYVSDDPNQIELFPKHQGCMSVYGLCERA